MSIDLQGGRGTGKTGNLVLTFSRQEKKGNYFVTQGKFLRHKENIFDCIYYCKKHISLHIFSIFLASLCLAYFLVSDNCFFLILFLPVYLCPTFYVTLVTSINQTYFGSFKNKLK